MRHTLNPSEYERMVQERNEQYRKEMDSSRLVFLRDQLRKYKPKAEKEAILGEIRELEVRLGISAKPYNGGVDAVAEKYNG